MKAFMFSFILFMSAYLWATSHTLSIFEKGVIVLNQSQNESECLSDNTSCCDCNFK